MDLNADNAVGDDKVDLFKVAFKIYKRRDKPLDLSAVFDAETYVDDGSKAVSKRIMQILL
jgi:hypothetical protein